jgi:hypothetical protein
MWEYKVLYHTAERSDRDLDELANELNAAARQDWEPVNLSATTHEEYIPVLLYVLMRRPRR